MTDLPKIPTGGPTICGAEHPDIDAVHCVRRPEHPHQPHAAPLGAHPVVDAEGRPTGEYDWEWYEWSDDDLPTDDKAQ